MKKDPRPKEYLYYKQLLKHVDNDTSIFFNDNKFIYPRQFEIHLPCNHKVACNLNCPHCAGKYFKRDLGNWELTIIELLDKLKGKIPYHIYGGAYTEPLLNPYYMTFLAMTKKYNNNFGIHTNGTFLNKLEDEQGWLTELNRISTDRIDYLSISIDAGFAWSWAKTKGTKNQDLFVEIIKGIQKASKLQRENSHAIRICYLISPESGTYDNFTSIISIAKDLGVDSVRFSIPFGNYNQSFNKIRQYKNKVEIDGDIKYRKLLDKLVSEDMKEKPYIFYTGPEFTDIDDFNFNKCIYGYYQVTIGADGFMYKCSTSASPTGSQCRIGKVTSDLEEFKRIIVKNYNENWDCHKMCFDNGIRCNRMGFECNNAYKELVYEK